MDAEAIITAIREVLEGELGSVRVVAAGALQSGGEETINDEALALRALSTPCYDLRMPAPERTGAIGPVNANLAVLLALPRIVITHPTRHPADEDGRYDVRFAAANLARTVTRALTWPGNLTATAAGAATGLISGVLQELAAPEVIRADWRKGIYQTQLRFRGLIREVQATDYSAVTGTSAGAASVSGDVQAA